MSKNLFPNPNQEPLILGNPNNFIDYWKISVYPNPAINTLVISKNYFSNNPDNIEKVWLVPGNESKIYQNEDFSEVYDENTYDEETVADKAILQSSDVNDDDIFLDLRDIDDGYYKVFIKTGNKIYWDNIHKGGIEIEKLKDYWN